MSKSFGYYCLRYVGFALMITAALVVIVYAVFAFAPDLANRLFASGGGSGVGVVTVILPAMLTAQVFYKYEQRRMGALEGWSLALAFTVLAIVLSAVIFLATLQLVPLTDLERQEVSALWNNDKSVLFGIIGVMAVFLLLINKLMLWSGVRGEIKKAERAAAKS